ncbi:MAG: PAS domain S-box protein [Verrucomicrobia bacterium]|nr:PAS domain S-box protein [Verrucomicrobiota bacterium]MBV8485384.1 PAS domain S-box protein [Verrucomicrobiota bacterium]
MATDLDISSGGSQFLHLLDKLPAAAYTCDAEGLITYYNQPAVRLWGRTPRLCDPADRFCGSFRLHSSNGEPIPHDECWTALTLRDDREYLECEVTVERPDGERRTASVSASPIHDQSGKLIGAVNILFDITERKRAEEALKETDRARNEFLAVLSHELRNPLAAIPFAIELLRPVVTHSPESRSALEVIDRQTHQIAKLVDDLVDLARLSLNKLELHSQCLDLTEVLRALVKASQPLIEAAGQTLTVTLPAESIFVYGDPTRLKQVIASILQNAIKYNTRCGQIWLEFARQDREAVIKVKDSGVGISAAVLDHIFEIFAQVKPWTTGPQTGLGVGLGVAKRLVDLHQGHLYARSEGPGKGSEFEVRLPVADSPGSC